MAVGVYLDPEPYDALDRLHSEEPSTAKHIEAMIDKLSADPGDRSLRQRQLRRPPSPVPMWGFTVRGREQDYLVLWQHTEASAVDIRYVGPDR